MLSQFELEVLGYVADDYEAVHTILGNLERDLGQTISDEELFSALTNLAHAGLVDTFEYNQSANSFSKISPTTAVHSGQFWFLANPTGVATYESHHA